MSQAELGEECGLLQEYVSAVESGRLNLTIGTMVRIALALEAEVLRLLRRRRYAFNTRAQRPGPPNVTEVGHCAISCS